MVRRRTRVNLNDGLKLDLNRLTRQGIIKPGFNIGPKFIRWNSVNTGNEIASGIINAITHDDEEEGLLHLALGNLAQWITLQAEPRHFGGRQWYFVCPDTQRRVSVLWRPPGARRFASRHAWRGKVAYGSQFETQFDRAIRGRNTVMAQLSGSADERCYFPPKPKWMRWLTYDRHVEKLAVYEQKLDDARLQFVLKVKSWTTDFDT